MKVAACFFAFLALSGSTLAREKKSSVRAPNSAASFVVKPCSESDPAPTSAEYVTTFRTFSQGAVRVFEMDTYGEPACCSSHLIVYFPMKNEPMSARCFHVASSPEGLGFSSVDLAAAKAKYDPKVGLGLTMPFNFYVDGIKNNKVTATVIINQDKETVTVK